MIENLIILDTETNGQTRQEPIQIAMVAIDWDFNRWMKPKLPCLPVAIAVHGKSNANLLPFPTVEEVFKKYGEALFFTGQDRYIFCGYNVAFDIEVISNACQDYLGKKFEPKKTLDVLAIARKLIPISEVGSHSLDTVYTYLFPEKLEHMMLMRGIHSADVDCLLTEEVLMELWKKLPDIKTLDELCAYASAPTLLTEWPFGKHKGELIKDVVIKDLQYVRWFMTKCDFRSSWKDLEFTLNQLKK